LNADAINLKMGPSEIYRRREGKQAAEDEENPVEVDPEFSSQ